MEKIRIQGRRGRRRSVSFNPNSEFIAKSVDEYLQQGGKITRIEKINGNFENFVAMTDSTASVDDFLRE